MLYRQEEKHMKRTNFSLTEKQMERLRTAFPRKRDFLLRSGSRRAVDAFLAWGDPTYTPLPSRPTRNAPFIPMSQALGLSGAESGNKDSWLHTVKLLAFIL